MKFATLLLLTVGLLAATAAVSASSHIIKGQIHAVPAGWTKLARAAPETHISLMIMIHQENTDKLLDTFYAVSNPQLASYGKYLSLEEVNTLVAPTEANIASVLQWLSRHGVHTTRETLTFTSNRDMLRVEMTVGEAEKLLHAEYFHFTHKTHDLSLIRTMKYSIPEYLQGAIDSIGPTVRFPSTSTVRLVKPAPKTSLITKLRSNKKHSTKKTVAADPCQGGSVITPACLKSLYSIGDYEASASTESTIAVTGFIGQYIELSDLTSFEQQYSYSGDARVPTIIGSNDQTQPGVEASLDIQYSIGLAAGVPATFWYTAAPDNEPFLDFLMALSSDSTPPLVISTSYGENEGDVAVDHYNRVNAEFQKAAVRGISFLFSSGDGGVAGSQSSSCTDFLPTFPAASPFVTAVGATTSVPETAAYFSSGGFSNYASAPAYQTSAVQAYLTNYGTSTLPSDPSVYNATGRGFPDVSFQGTNFQVIVGGATQGVAGTSCSSPSFAGVVALLNDARLNAGKAPLGFLNQFLYQNPSMFNDITSGNNPGCNTNGFTAVTAWDPVTGLGTPNFPAMLKAVQALP